MPRVAAAIVAPTARRLVKEDAMRSLDVPNSLRTMHYRASGRLLGLPGLATQKYFFKLSLVLRFCYQRSIWRRATTKDVITCMIAQLNQYRRDSLAIRTHIW